MIGALVDVESLPDSITSQAASLRYFHGKKEVGVPDASGHHGDVPRKQLAGSVVFGQQTPANVAGAMLLSVH